MPARRSYLVFASFYFTQFATLGIFIPYFPLYLKSLDLSGSRIGVLMALGPVSRFLFPAFWGLWADRGGHRKRLIVLSAIGSAAAFALFFTVRDFGPLAAVLFLYGFLLVPATPLLEGMVQEATERHGFAYGPVRLWGSLGFIGATLLYGTLLDRHPMTWILGGILILSLLNIVPASALPAGGPASGIRRPSLRRETRRPAVIRFLACTTLMQASHGAYYAYYSLHLDRQGYSRTAIGAYWTLAVAAEIVIMLRSAGLLARSGTGRLISACFALAVLRWSMLAIGSGPVLLAAAQILHAFTFGLFHVSAVVHTHRLFPAELRSSGQSLYSSLTYGLGNLIGYFGSAALFAPVGIPGLFGLSAAVSLLAFLLSRGLEPGGVPARHPAA